MRAKGISFIRAEDETVVRQGNRINHQEKKKIWKAGGRKRKRIFDP